MEVLTGYRLSPHQRRLLARQRHMSLPPSQLVIQLTGLIDKDHLAAATEKVIDQDAVFRTTYTHLAGNDWPMQVVNETADYMIHETLTNDPLAEKDTVLRTAAAQHFDMERGPLLRLDIITGPGLTSVTIPARINLVIITMPAICADFSSLTILANQLITTYLALQHGTAGPDNDILPYLQFSEWQNQLQETDAREEGLNYWLKNNPQRQSTPLIFDEDPGQMAGYTPAYHDLTLPPDAYAGMPGDALGPALGLCWQWLLWFFSGKQSVVTGHTDTGREFEELNRTVGLLSCCMPVAIPISQQRSFDECLTAYRHVLESNDEYKVFYAAAHTMTDKPAVFDYAFELSDMPTPETFEIVQQQTASDAIKIQLRCTYDGKIVRSMLQYNEQAFSRESISLLAQVYADLVMQCLSDGSLTPGDINLLPPATTRSIQDAFNRTTRVFPQGDLTVDALFDRQAGLYPDSIAVTDGDRMITYADLQKKANALARFLKNEKNILPGDRIALLCGEDQWMIIGMLGILKAGAGYVPVDPANPSERVRIILENSSAHALITEKQWRPDATVYSGEIICLDEDGWLDHAATPGNQPSPTSSQRLPSSVAYVIYTSGTTGTPKGVMIPDRALVNYVCWLQDTFGIDQEDSSVLLSSFAFDLGYTAIWGSLLSGGCLHLVPARLIKAPEEVVNYIAHKNIRFIKTTPSLLQVILSAANAGRLADSALRLVFMGGESIRVKDLEYMTRLKPNIMLVNHYGPTETTIGTVAAIIDKNRLRAYAAQPVIGRPVANNLITILDEHNQPVVPGIPGELCVSGTGLALGYLGRPDLTEEKFIPHPYIPGLTMYRTGDLASWTATGNVLFLGRKDDQVKIRGHRVELNEVQHTLLKYEGIGQAAIIAVTGAAAGPELAAYYTSEVPITAGQLRTFLSTLLPDAFVPAYFIRLANLPLTANGKLNKKALPDPVSTVRSATYAPPRNETETKMTELWKTVLNIHQPGIKDDFFDLGGHSLKAIQLASLIHKTFNVKIDIAKIFAHPTVELLAALVLASKQQQFDTIQPLPVQPYYALSHAQQRFWLLSQFYDGTTAYNVPVITILEGTLDLGAFRRVLHALIERHENLRTVFVTVNGELFQKVLPATDIHLTLHEVDLRSEQDVAATAEAWTRQDAQQSFDLLKGPLLRASLIRTDDQRYLFLFTIHHIVSDGWSRALLTREQLHLYRAYTSGKEPSLPPLRLQYKDYAAWHSSTWHSHEHYWQQLYQDNVPVSRFPADFDRPPVLTFAGALIRHTLPAGMRRDLQEFASIRHITLNNLMFALYGLLVGHYSGQQDVVIGALAWGRSHIDLEQILGAFVNFLPIRLSFSPDEPLGDYLARSHQTLTGAYQHQDYPFDILVDKFLPGRDLSRNPFFDTMVNFHWEDDLYTQEIGDDGYIAGTSLRMQPYRAEHDMIQSVLDFKVDIHPAGDTLELNFAYNPKLFTAEKMEGFLQHYCALLTAAVTMPEQPLTGYLPSLTGASPELPVNICSSFVAEPLEEYLLYWSDAFEMGMTIQFSPYNQMFQQLLGTDSFFYRKDGINICFIRPEDWLRDLDTSEPARQIALLEKNLQELMQAFRFARENDHKPWLIGVVPLSPDTRLTEDVQRHLRDIQGSLTTFFSDMPACYPLDLPAIATLYTVTDIFDPITDEAGHLPFTREYYAALGTFLSRKLRALQSPPYKVIALDCDNTLWKGICGEDGSLGVIVDEHYKGLQQFLLEKYDEGFLLVLISKNNEADVREVFSRNTGMLLQWDHIAAHRINWDAKADNLVSLAAELNLGTDSFIFLDDSEFEIEQLSTGCPEALALLLPQAPEEFEVFLRHNWAFDRLQITAEDRERNAMHKAEKERRQARVDSGLLEDFIRSLEIRVDIQPLTPADMDRAVQLTQRTNQFNLNGITRSPADIIQLLRDPHALTCAITVEDRFGKYGMTGLVLATAHKTALSVNTFLLSCRVLGRGVEDKVLDALRTHAISKGLRALTADFIPTAKNKPFHDFLSRTHWIIDPEKNSFTLPAQGTA